MDRFLEGLNYQSSQEEMNNRNSFIPIKEIRLVVKNLPTRNLPPGPGSFTGESYQTFKEEIIPTPQKLFQKIEKEYFPTNSMKPAFLCYQDHTKTLQETTV